MFLLSTGKAGKFFINELTKLFNAWIDDSPLTKLVMKAVMIMPSLLLQKPSKESQSKDHLKALQWRIELWQSSDPLGLLQDSLTIQRNLKSAKAWKTVAKTSKNFVEEIRQWTIETSNRQHRPQNSPFESWHHLQTRDETSPGLGSWFNNLATWWSSKYSSNQAWRHHSWRCT